LIRINLPTFGLPPLPPPPRIKGTFLWLTHGSGDSQSPEEISDSVVFQLSADKPAIGSGVALHLGEKSPTNRPTGSEVLREAFCEQEPMLNSIQETNTNRIHAAHAENPESISLFLYQSL
jgi:hypothetical protein